MSNVVSLKFVEEFAVCFVSGHDFSRAVSGPKSDGLQPLRAFIGQVRPFQPFEEFQTQDTSIGDRDGHPGPGLARAARPTGEGARV